jgi:uncharacterized Rossmann fold enzyme
VQLLKINPKCVVDAEGRLAHIKSALERELPEFGPSEPHDKEIVIVGTGPSVKNEVAKIRKLKKKGAMILAVKGAHDFLIDRGIMPHAAVCVDPMPDQIKYYKRKGKDITYLIASQCHPAMFDYLKDESVIVWHMLATSSHDFLKGRLQIGGGSTTGTRGIVLAWMMGFRDIHLFGFDSSLVGDGKEKLRKVDGETWGNDKQPVMELVCEGKTFYSDPAMAAQANEIQDVVKMLYGSRFKAYGKGLIQTIFAANARKGLEGYYAVGDKFGESRVPPVRKADAEYAKKALAASRSGVYRGRSYYPDKAA